MIEDRNISMEKIFQSCSFDAAIRSNEAIKSHDNEVSVAHNNITSFFVDSSGRSSFTVPLQMTFAKKKDLEELLMASCFDPPPCNLVPATDPIEDGNDKNEGDGGETVIAKDTSATILSPAIRNKKKFDSVAFEVKSVPSDHDDPNQVTVEGVSIISCSVKNLVVTFKTKVTVRATTRGSPSASVSTSTDSLAPMSPSRFSSSLLRTKTMKNCAESELELKQQQQLQQINISTSFKIIPVLTIENSSIRHRADDKNKNEVNTNYFSPDLTLLELAAIQMQYNNNNKAASSVLSTSNDKFHEIRLSPIIINVTLTNAFTITVQSVLGPKSRTGNTLVSLSIQHSNTHNLPVTITNISVHPGHSRHNVFVARNNVKTNINKNEGPPKIQQAVSNMTDTFEWGYAPKTELKLPLTMLPYEAYSSIIFINAGEERNCRQFLSPLSVTGVIEMNSNIETDDSETRDDNNNDNVYREQCRVVVASDAYWTTKPIAVEPADAFRIVMSTIEPIVKRGKPMVIKLRIFNLSLQSRNLMIFMAKNEHSPSSHNKNIAVKEESVNAAVVTESDGYTFGVWGISGDDDGTVRLNRDHELLAIDTALVLGEVQGQHAVDAELRFVPLRLGRLKVPNWKLYDKAANRWYSCTHSLIIVAI